MRIPSRFQDVVIVFETINSQSPIVIASVNIEGKDLLVRLSPKTVSYLARSYVL